MESQQAVDVSAPRGRLLRPRVVFENYSPIGGPVTETERQVRAYVHAVMPEGTVHRVTAFTELRGGENHAVYKLSYTDVHDIAVSVIVRVATSAYARDFATAEREAAVLAKVRGVAAPLLYDFRHDSQWFDAPVMCMQFIDGDQRPPRTAEDARRLGQALGSLHALPSDDLPGLASTQDLSGYLESRLIKIEEKLAFVRDPLPESVQRRIQSAVLLAHENLERARHAGGFSTDDRLVLLHGDVAGGNILWDPDPVLIDWEYARVGDAADEIAYIFNQNEMTASGQRSFWKGYGDGYGSDRALDHLVARVQRWAPITVLGSALFWTQLWCLRAEADAAGDVDPAASRGEDNYESEATRRLDRVESLFTELARGQSR